MAKNPAAVALGRKGGMAYAKNTAPEDRKKAAQKAATARWQKALDKLEAKIEARETKARTEKARQKRHAAGRNG